MTENLFNIKDIGVVSTFDFLIGIFELLIICFVFKYAYDKYSTSVSNRKLFSFYFIPFSISIFLIVVTIKSSLVLSLGLVGALSIIRFRTAIKETEQIISLLYLTGVSISIAANQLLLPVITTSLIFLFFFFRSKLISKNDNKLNVIVSELNNFEEVAFNLIIQEIEQEFKININLISITENKNSSNIVFSVSDFNIFLYSKFKKLVESSKMEILEINTY